MTVGGALDYYSGVIQSVPNVLVKLKSEWLWRLIQEPKRVSRIFDAVVVFPAVVLFSQIKMLKSGP